jgi:prolyl-tRNA editing enzyme YbaK/EbsC (Cys-tRNA(Pro) deacylase)
MPTISQKKKDKVKEQILHHLFDKSPEAIFTSKIADSIARDEEFIKTLLHELNKDKLVIAVNKNPKGIQYLKRQRWRLSDAAFQAYSKHLN